jgi:hypothetical protein
MAGPTDPGGMVAPQYTDVVNCLTYPDPSNHEISTDSEALFRCKKFLDFDTIVFSFLFDKHCLIIE